MTLENQGRIGDFLKGHRRDEPVRVVPNSYPQGEDKFLWKATGSATNFKLLCKKLWAKIYAHLIR